jgi:hypothetical protein
MLPQVRAGCLPYVRYSPESILDAAGGLADGRPEAAKAAGLPSACGHDIFSRRVFVFTRGRLWRVSS